MIDIKVYSTIHDKNIKKNIKQSPIWKNANFKEELVDVSKHWLYKIRFDGLTPVQVLKVQKPGSHGRN